jgi:hypothetical protein
MQYSTRLRNARLNVIADTVGPSAYLQIRSGAPPADCSKPDAGDLLCEMALPKEWMGRASGGNVSANGTWTGEGVAAGNAGHFRVKDTAKRFTDIQGTVGATGDNNADAEIDNIVIAPGQTVTMKFFGITGANA